MPRRSGPPRLTVLRAHANASAAGITLDPAAPDPVRVLASLREGNVIIRGYLRRDALGEYQEPIIALDIPEDDAVAVGVDFVRRIVDVHGFTDEGRPPLYLC